MGVVEISLDPRLFRLAAVKKAAYRLGDRCFAQIELLPDGAIRVRLTAKSDQMPLSELEGTFRNELLDQELREAIAEETAGVRKLLLAQAFSAVPVAGDVAETADFRDDPLDIARSQSHHP